MEREIFKTVINKKRYIISLREIAVGYECEAYKDDKNKMFVAHALGKNPDDAIILLVCRIENTK